MFRKPRNPGLVLLLASIAALPLVAQETDAGRDLEALLDTQISSVSKRSETILNAPQAVEVLSGDDLRAMGVYRLADALRLLTSVNILELDSHVTHVGLRGVMQDGAPRTVQILIDGVPLYNAEIGSVDIDNIPLPVDMIERIEVVRGPSSTLYGANAVAGVIAITTRPALQGIKAGARLSMAEKNTTRGSAWALWGAGAFSLSAGASSASLGETNHVTHFVDGTTVVPPYISDKTHSSNYFVRPQWQKGDATLWAEYGNAHKKTWSVGFPYEMLETRIAQAGWRQRWMEKLSTELTYSHTGQDLITGADPPVAIQVNDPGFNSEYAFGKYAHEQIAVQTNWDFTDRLHLVAGADHRRYKVGASPVLGFAVRQKESATSGFVNFDGNLHKKFTLSFGMRFENETIGGSRTSPRLSAVFSPTEKSSVRVGYFESTRSPQLTESRTFFSNAFDPCLFTLAPSPPFPPGICVIGVFQVLPNPDLKPENIRSAEAGYRQAFGPFTLDLTVFRMKFKDLIVEQPVAQFIDPTFNPFDPGTWYPPNNTRYYIQAQYQNRGSATDEGVELALTWQPVWGVTVGGNSTWLSYRDDDTDAEQAYTPRNTTNLWARLNRNKFTAYLGFQRQSEQLIASLNAGGIPTYERRDAINQVHASAGYEFWKGLALTGYAWNAAKEFTPQGAGGPTRSATFRDARREVGLTLSWKM